MSQENVATVRRAYAAFSEGNLGPVLEAFDPDIEWNASDVFFDQPRTYRGRQTWQEQFLPELGEIFQEYRVVPERLIDVGEHVVAVAHVGGRGRRSGADVMARVAHMLTFRDGRVVKFTEFKAVGEAFKSVGLSEQDAHAEGS
jgi:ketosteroid isomerase-like protein